MFTDRLQRLEIARRQAIMLTLAPLAFACITLNLALSMISPNTSSVSPLDSFLMAIGVGSSFVLVFTLPIGVLCWLFNSLAFALAGRRTPSAEETVQQRVRPGEHFGQWTVVRADSEVLSMKSRLPGNAIRKFIACVITSLAFTLVGIATSNIPAWSAMQTYTSAATFVLSAIIWIIVFGRSASWEFRLAPFRAANAEDPCLQLRVHSFLPSRAQRSLRVVDIADIRRRGASLCVIGSDGRRHALARVGYGAMGDWRALRLTSHIFPPASTEPRPLHARS